MKNAMSLCVLIAFASTGASAQDTMQPRGETIVRATGETGYRPSGPAPSFASLDGNADRSISADEAVGYALLANDFIMADGNRDGRISQREYDRWASRP